jgi:hypothetical protein
MSSEEFSFPILISWKAVEQVVEKSINKTFILHIWIIKHVSNNYAGIAHENFKDIEASHHLKLFPY